MRVLITGCNGQLGQALQRQVPPRVEVMAVDIQALDICDADAVSEVFAQFQPDLVINAAAYTAVDRAEQEPALAYAVNTEAVGNLATACEATGARFIHISTDFVFDGRQSTPYQPTDIASPLSVYGGSKLDGERRVIECLPGKALVIRVGWLYSYYGNNFAKTMLRLMRERDQLGVVADQVGTPTHAEGLAQAIWQFAGEAFTAGTYHWSDAGVASWYDFAVAIMEEGVTAGLVDRPIPIRPITTSDYPTPAKRPAYSVLDKTATWSHLGSEPAHWREALRRMLRKL